MRDRAGTRRQNRSLVGVVAAGALVYPMLLAAVRLVFAQLLDHDTGAVVGWGAVGLLCSIGVVLVVRWSTGRPLWSPWLLTGLVPPVLFELWLYWPAISA